MKQRITHTEFAHATLETVWGFWSDLSTWSKWDLGVEKCELKEGHRFEQHGEAKLWPKGSPVAVNIRITECTPLRSFVDEGVLELGQIQFSHQVVPSGEGVKITHTLVFIPANEQAGQIFEKRMLPKLQTDLPLSVKTLAKLAEQASKVGAT